MTIIINGSLIIVLRERRQNIVQIGVCSFQLFLESLFVSFKFLDTYFKLIDCVQQFIGFNFFF
jgi:hypothetical protein